MYNKLIFFNHCHAGDVFESKEFVRDIYPQVSAKECYYTHGQDQRIFLDIPYIKQTAEFLHHMNPGTATLDINGDFWINTWIGRTGKYVLPGSGCVVEMLHKMYQDMNFKLRPDIYSYIPEVDFRCYKRDGILDNLEAVENKNKVLICSGLVHSAQAENFDFSPIVQRLADNFPSVVFYYTSQLSLQSRNNLFYTRTIIGDLSSDLNEIGYLSTFCDLIVGRCSGPHVFTMHKTNCLDSSKAFLSFTHTQENSHFVLSDGLPMKKYWSTVSNADEVYNKIVEVMRERNIV